MGRRECDGTIRTLHAQHVLFTGKTYVHGEHVFKPELRRMVRNCGATDAPDRSRRVTLLVVGDLDGQVIVDPINHRSQKLVFVDEQRRLGNHICVVDDTGFTALLDGYSARCLETRLIGGERGHEVIEVSLPPALQDSDAGLTPVLGVPISPHGLPHHQDTRLQVDLTHLDRATAAHEEILDQLDKHLAISGVTVRSPSPGMPLFDAGWADPLDESTLFIAEVKSLTGTVEAQQIRLGLGQVLDYSHSIWSDAAGQGLTIVPALVLQREPAEKRWASLARSLGVVLTWPPNFPGI